MQFLIADSPVLIRDRSSQKTTFSSLDGSEEVTLTCEFDGFPTPKVKFVKDGIELNTSDVTSRSGFASYKFRVRSLSDFGFYSCVATNSRGKKTYYMEVYERGKFKNMLWFTSEVFSFFLRCLERHCRRDSSSRRIIRLVHVFILEAPNQMNYKCFPSLSRRIMRL